MKKLSELLHDPYRFTETQINWMCGKSTQAIWETCGWPALMFTIVVHALGLSPRERLSLVCACVAPICRYHMPAASREAFDVIVRYGEGKATEKEFNVARAAAEKTSMNNRGVDFVTLTQPARSRAWATQIAYFVTYVLEIPNGAISLRNAMQVKGSFKGQRKVGRAMCATIRELYPFDKLGLDPDEVQTENRSIVC
jgi:hypothetical protein